MKPNLDEQIAAALGLVCDPCSIAANAPVSIVDMGLVNGWSVDEEGNLTVSMCVTSPSCTMGPNMALGAEKVLNEIPGIKSTRIDFDAAVFWTPDSMSERGKQILANRRALSGTKAGLKPQQWRDAARSTVGVSGSR